MSLPHLENKLPSLDTYFFSRRLFECYEKNWGNLMKECYKNLADAQVKELKISGKSMDSKLIGGNIARCSHYVLIHRTLTKLLYHRDDIAVYHMLQEVVANSEKATETQVGTVYTDGAYQSPENRDLAKSHGDMQLKTGRMRGGGQWKL